MKFQIKKGKHYASTFKFGIHFGVDRLEKTVKLHDNCFYDLNNADNLDENKLFGLTYDFFGHNSLRISWNVRTDAKTKQRFICLYGYCHLNGKRLMPKTLNGFTIGINYRFNEPIQCSIELDKGIAYFKASQHAYSGEQKLVKIPFGVNPSWGYYQRPYFGGNETAPHNMEIEII